jgi:ADP-heptose:LPS heptosyltransferase
MGDVAMTVPVLKQLVANYPKLRVTVVTKPFFAPLFNDIPNLTVFKADVKQEFKGVFGLYKLYKQLNSLQIEAVADMHNVLRSKILRTYFKLGGIPTFKIDKGRADKKALTREKNKVFKPLKSTHERYADVLRTIGFLLQLRPVKMRPIKLEDKLESLLQPLHQKLIGVAPFAAHQGKQYPLDQMVSVIEALSKKQHTKVILFGGGLAEVEVLTKIASQYKNVICLAGKLEFKNELQVISNLNLMIGMDSGNGHLAAMFGVPVLTVWGATHPFAGFVPFCQPEANQLIPDLKKYPKIPTSIYGNKIPNGYENAMNSIPAEEITKRALQIVEA